MYLSSLYFILTLIAFIITNVTSICSLKECSCTVNSDQNVSAICHFQKRLNRAFSAKNFPERLSHLELIGGREFRFGPGVFVSLHYLETVYIKNVTNVYVQTYSFANLTSKTIKFEFTDISVLVFEQQSFKHQHNPVSVLIEKIATVTIQRQAFACLTELNITDVHQLELLDEALLFENPISNIDEALSTVITFKNVSMKHLARSTFHSLADKVNIINSEIKKIKTEAFDALVLGNILIQNCIIFQIETRAFSDRTLLNALHLNNVTINEISSNAIQSGLTYLNITYSKIGTIKEGGVNTTVAFVNFENNSFGRIATRGFTFQMWDTINIRNNTFEYVDTKAFNSPYYQSTKISSYNFTGNILSNVKYLSFDFLIMEEVTVYISNNFFKIICHCEMLQVLEDTISGSASIRENFLESSLCTVDKKLSQCFQLPTGFMHARNFTDLVCNEPRCEDVRDIVIAPVDTIFQNESGEFKTNLMYGNEVKQWKLLICILILIAGCLCFLIVAANCTAIKRFLRQTSSQLRGFISKSFVPSNINRLERAPSIIVLPIQKYESLHVKNQITLSDEGSTEDKTTQTLPEERTQEILEALRQKLNDPNQYQDARAYIEHMYDLIQADSKSLNFNSFDDNIYSEIETELSNNENDLEKCYVSIGTKVQTPVRLLPKNMVDKSISVSLSDYMEPQDKAVNIYSELPNGDISLPIHEIFRASFDKSVHIYTEPITEANKFNESKMVNRPLPLKPEEIA